MRRFLDQIRQALGGLAPDITPGALDLLRSYCWPGNVRQLRNVVRRAGLMAPGKVTAEHIKACIPQLTRTVVQLPRAAAGDAPLRDMVQHRVKEVEHDAILHALSQARGNKTTAARQLGIDYKTFRIKLKAIEKRAAVKHAIAGP